MNMIRNLGWWKIGLAGLIVAGAMTAAVVVGRQRAPADEPGQVFSYSEVAGEATEVLAPRPEEPEGPGEKPEGDLKVVFHRPTGRSPYHVQVQAGFDAPLVPLTNVTDESRAKALSHFSITPKPKGVFRLVGIQAVVFSPESPFPAASTYTVTIKAGLEDVHGRKLKEDFSWKFNTEPLTLSFGYGQRNGVTLKPEFGLSVNGAVDVKSLTQHLKCVQVMGGDKTKAVNANWKVTASKNNPPPIQEVTEYRRRYRYTLKAQRTLQKATSYKLTIAAGVKPTVGNVVTTQDKSLTFSTYGPLTFSFIQGKCGRRLQQSYRVSHSNPLEPETIKGALSISPPIEGETAWASPYSTNLYLPDSQLKPDTDYTVTVSTKVRDVFGQRLAKPWVHKFHTAHYRPDIEVMGGLRLLSPRTDPVLPYRVSNPRTLKSRLLSVTESLFLNWAFEREVDECEEVLDAHDEETRKLADPYKEDAVELKDLELGDALNDSGFGLVFYGLQTTEEDRCHGHHVVHREGAILRTNLGVHAQLLPAGMHVWVTHLTDGSAAAGCQVSIHRYAKEKGGSYWDRDDDGLFDAPVQVFTGKADENGRLTIPSARLLDPSDAGQRYLRGDNGLVVIAREGDDFAYATNRYWLRTQVRDPWDWDGPRYVSLGSLFTDRQLYQPDEDVPLKAVVRYRTQDRIGVPKGVEFHVTVDDPRGGERDLGKVKTDDFGTFSLTVKPKPGEPLGYYYVYAKSGTPKLAVSGSFRRADFRPPRYKAKLTTDKSIYFVGQKIKAYAKGDYLFGAPLAGGTATFRANTRAQSFTPKGWEEFRFSIPEWIRYEMQDRESPEKSLLQATKRLGDTGRAEVGVPVVADDVPEPMSYHVEVDVKDVSGKSVGASRSVTVLPYTKLSGVRMKRCFAPAKEPTDADVIVTDAEGKPQAGVKLTVELLSVKWVWKEVKHNGYTDEDYVRETKVVSTQSVTSGAKPVTVSVKPPEAGQYLAIARFAGRKPTGTEGAGWLYAHGASVGRERGREDSDLELRTDKEEYQVGDEVQVAVPSPFKRARALFTVEREKVFEQQFEEISQGVATFKFRVTKQMIPNVYAYVALTEKGPESGNLFGDEDHVPYRWGSVEVKVSRAPHRLEVKVSPRDPRVGPADKAVVNLHVDDANGKPAQVQLTVMAVDEAILQLTGYRPPDLVEQVLLHRGLSLAVWDNRPLVMRGKKKLPAPPKGWGYGDGEGGMGIVAARLRKDFKHLAHFDPDLRTDRRGNARCEFTVPDNLTTWRVLAVAVSRENDFGSGEATFVVSQPLMLQGLLPRFARVDDSITTGVAVNNQTGVKGKATVTCRLTKGDDLLKPLGQAKTQDSVEIADKHTGAVRFPKRAVGVGDTVMQFACKLEGKDKNGKPVSAADRLELPLVVQEPGYWETVAVAREVPQQVRVPLKLTDAIRSDLGEVKVSLTSTAFGNLVPDVQWLIDYPYGCAEQISSRMVGLLAIREPVKRFGIDLKAPKPLDELIKLGIDGLLKCQNSNGGFGYWVPGRYPDRFLSCYVATVLAEAKRQGFDVSKSALTRLADYLKGLQPHPLWSEETRLHFRVMQGIALLALDDQLTEHYGDLMTKRKKLSLIDWVRLDHLFQHNDEWSEQAAELYTEIKKREWITERGVHLEEWKAEDGPWRYLDTVTALTSAGLKLDLFVDPKHERVAKTANFLVNSQRRLRWRNTYDTARVLDALSRYIEVREATKPNFTASVSVGRGKSSDFRFRGYELGLQEETFPLSSLKKGAEEIIIEKAGHGALYSTIELKYVPKGEQPPQSQGFFIEREMTNLRTKKPVASTKDEIRLGDIVRVKLTLNAPQQAYNVVVESPVPAGLEPVETSFKTAPSWARREARGSAGDGWYSNPFDHTEFHRDHIALFSQSFWPGVYEYTYLLQATNPGTFTYPPTRIYRMYEPEEFGSTKSGRVKVGE